MKTLLLRLLPTNQSINQSIILLLSFELIGNLYINYKYVSRSNTSLGANQRCRHHRRLFSLPFFYFCFCCFWDPLSLHAHHRIDRPSWSPPQATSQDPRCKMISAFRGNLFFCQTTTVWYTKEGSIRRTSQRHPSLSRSATN